MKVQIEFGILQNICKYSKLAYDQASQNLWKYCHIECYQDKNDTSGCWYCECDIANCPYCVAEVDDDCTDT